ncbi:LOW QUALITY PROTEIN: hypothetical protein V1477_013491 [Vespula maculifrons]|uniref:Uncharacterized protein n=1 Tax=Vespula maculifrons TaxID=7453 RepID=A0ABD2BEM2_VESMC
MQCRDRRFRETTTKSGLGPTFKVTSSVVLWTSTRELRNFRGCHPCKHKCRLGILGFERRQQSTVFDRTLHSVVLLTSTGALRNLRGCHPCKLKYSVGKVGFGRRQHSRVLDRPFQLLLLLCFGLRRYTLETIADAIHASTNE